MIWFSLFSLRKTSATCISKNEILLGKVRTECRFADESSSFFQDQICLLTRRFLFWAAAAVLLLFAQVPNQSLEYLALAALVSLQQSLLTSLYYISPAGSHVHMRNSMSLSALMDQSQNNKNLCRFQILNCIGLSLCCETTTRYEPSRVQRTEELCLLTEVSIISLGEQAIYANS